MVPLDVKCMDAVTLLKSGQSEILVCSAISRSKASPICPSRSLQFKPEGREVLGTLARSSGPQAQVRPSFAISGSCRSA
jgi:hypothetical protein